MTTIDNKKNWLELKRKIIKRPDIVEPLKKFMGFAATNPRKMDTFAHCYDFPQVRRRNPGMIEEFEKRFNISYLGEGRNRIILRIGTSKNYPKINIDNKDMTLCLKLMDFYGDSCYIDQNKSNWPTYEKKLDLKKDFGDLFPSFMFPSIIEEPKAFEYYEKTEESIPLVTGIIVSGGLIGLLQEDLTEGDSVEETYCDPSGKIHFDKGSYHVDLKIAAEVGCHMKTEIKTDYWKLKLVL